MSLVRLWKQRNQIRVGGFFKGGVGRVELLFFDVFIRVRIEMFFLQYYIKFNYFKFSSNGNFFFIFNGWEVMFIIIIYIVDFVLRSGNKCLYIYIFLFFKVY